jgi:tetratricopeptide (TPR) repeat protein
MRKVILGLGALVVLGSLACASKEQTSLKIYVQQKLYDKAIVQGLQALQKTPDSGDTHYFLGAAYFGKDADLNPEAEGYADSSEAYLRKAYTHFLKAKELAAGSWGKSVDDNIVSMFGRHYNRGVIHAKKGENAQAAVEYRLASVADPENYQGYYAHAAALLPMANEARKNDREEEFTKLSEVVLQDLDRVLELNPSEREIQVSSWQTKGEVLYKRGDTQKSQEAYTRAVELDPENYEMMATLADRFYNEQDWENAASWYEQSLGIQERLNLIEEGDLDTYNALANALVKLERREEALAAFDKALKLKPGDAVTLYNIMVTHYKSGEALATENKMDEAKGHYRQAIDIGNELIRIDPSRPEYWQVLGYCKRAMGDTAGAAQALKKFNDLRQQQTSR